jgi:hypothetical protein
LASLNIFLSPNDLLSKSKNLVLENSVFALGGSILLSEYRQRQKIHQYKKIDEILDLEISK